MEAFEFVRSPAQSDDLRDNVPKIPAPPRILDHEVFDRVIIDQRILESQEYICRLDSDGRQRASYDDIVESKRYEAEVRIAAMAPPLLRNAPRENANDVIAQMMPLLRQQFQEILAPMQQQLNGVQQQLNGVQPQLNVMQPQLNHIQRQLRISQYNLEAVSFNSSAFKNEAAIRASMNNEELLLFFQDGSF